MHDEVLRILDVNLNRSRDALRVVEDYARFVRDDADTAAAAKRCRHALRAIAESFGGDALLAARDIVGDVGRTLKTSAELARETTEDVVRAAFARLSEATRALGEYGKLVSADAAAAAESLRYEIYELEQRIILRSRLLQQFRTVRLYVLLTESYCRLPWQQTLEAAIRGGAGCIQLREKSLEGAALLERARAVRDITRKRGVLFAMNDRPDIARLADADILHVGQDDLPVREVRRLVGGAMLVGKSTHTVEQFDAALGESPDYLAVGPMFDSPTKPQPHIAGPQTLAAVRARTALPLVAIGGIAAANAARVRSAGADCVAVCSAVLSADDPESAARAIAHAAGA